MATGRLHIFALGSHKGKYGEAVREYQVDFNDAGATFTGVMEEGKLMDFLRTKVTLDAADLKRVLDGLRQTGRTTLSDIDLPEFEVTALGLVQQPSDA